MFGDRQTASPSGQYRGFNSAQLFVFTFAVSIIIGAVLLSLPFSTRSGRISFVDALFTSTSAVCVTGLVVKDTGSFFTPVGQLILLALIEIGGLGYMTFHAWMVILIRGRMSLKDTVILAEQLNLGSLEGIAVFVKYILGITFLFQALGAAVLSLIFLYNYGYSPRDAVWYGLFHAISAFNNAGFSLFSTSLEGFRSDPLLILTIASLIIAGGLGFSVWVEILEGRRLSLHSKIVLLTTAVSLALGMLAFLTFEWKNPKTFGELPFWSKLLNAFFCSVTPRTAGFDTIPVSGMTVPSVLVTLLLMFIGASPGGTGGGIKTTTAYIIFKASVRYIRGREEEVKAFGRSLSQEDVEKAFVVTSLSFWVVLLSVFALVIFENKHFLDLLFEAFSAFGTVGLSMGITPKLSTVGKIIITATMFAGRVGPLTLLLALAQRRGPRARVALPVERVIVG